MSSVPSRRAFLRHLGIGGAGLFALPLLSACNDDPIDPTLRATIDLRNDSGALNFASLLQQIQYEFYATSFAVYQGYVGVSALEFTVLQRLWTHHSGVRNLFRRVTPKPIEALGLQFNFNNVDFSNRGSVLGYAVELEDIATAAMHGVLRHAPDPETLTMLAKIASVEARHSATLRDLVDIGAGRANTTGRTNFASDDVVLANGANRLLTPAQAIELLRPRFTTVVTFREA